MSDTYLRFLSSPSESALAPGAALHYVTTTTTINDASAIVKHLQTQEKVVKKKNESILSSMSSSDGMVVETETTFEFISGGGAILPSMDANLLSDSTAIAAMVHVVQYDGQGKISQIRLYWDQATMLRQVEAIGKSGRNWPIRDGDAQARTIKSSVKASSSSSTASSLPSRPADANGSSSSNNNNNVVITDRSNTARNDRDYNSRIFDTGDSNQVRSSSPANPLNATRTSAKPAPREWDELFSNGESKGDSIPEGNPRSGAGKNYSANRLFDEGEIAGDSHSPERKKANPEKFNHFEFGNGENAPIVKPSKMAADNASKRQSQWDFQDFVTPEKIKSKPNPEQLRHIGPGLDEDMAPSPEKRPVVHAPRPDANAHFEISDDSPAGPKAPLNTGMHVDNARRGADSNHFSLGDSPDAQKENVSFGTSNKGRNDIQPQFEMSEAEQPKKIYKTAGNGMGGRAGAPTLWDEPEPTKEQPIYKTYGNGMGGRRDAGRAWSIGDEAGDEARQAASYKTRNDGVGASRNGTASSARHQQAMPGSDEYEF